MSGTVSKPKKSVALSGVVAGNTALCSVGQSGNDLHYRGYDILDIAEACEYEEVAHLLIHGTLPSSAELAAYKVKLRTLRGLPLAVLLGVLGILLVWSNIQQREASWTAVAHLLSTRPEFTPTVVPGVIPGTLDPALYRAAVSDGPVLAQLRTSWSGPGELPDEHTLLSNLRVLTDNQLR